MTHSTIEADQEQRLASYQAIDEIYLEGIGDGAMGNLPAMSEIVYLQGYCKGMEEIRKEIGLKITVSPQQLQSELFAMEDNEYPLVCHQCAHFNNGICAIKGITRNGNSYACPSISVDCPF